MIYELINAKIVKDEYGLCKKYGMRKHSEFHFSFGQNPASGEIHYYIFKMDVLSTEQMAALMQTPEYNQVCSPYLREATKCLPPVLKEFVENKGLSNVVDQNKAARWIYEDKSFYLFIRDEEAFANYREETFSMEKACQIYLETKLDTEHPIDFFKQIGAVKG